MGYEEDSWNMIENGIYILTFSRTPHGTPLVRAYAGRIEAGKAAAILRSEGYYRVVTHQRQLVLGPKDPPGHGRLGY
jgi:hypothetical protein